jgi:16S rRNA (guanine966-N2)-methyltransferase
LRQNISAVCKSLGRDAASLSILQMDAVSAPTGGSETPDLVFVDPPYEIIRDVSGNLFGHLTELLKGKVESLVIFEMPGEIELAPPGWLCVKRLGKGIRQPTVAFFRQI